MHTHEIIVWLVIIALVLGVIWLLRSLVGR